MDAGLDAKLAQCGGMEGKRNLKIARVKMWRFAFFPPKDVAGPRTSLDIILESVHESRGSLRR